jgi:hypothetical protein
LKTLGASLRVAKLKYKVDRRRKWLATKIGLQHPVSHIPRWLHKY